MDALGSNSFQSGMVLRSLKIQHTYMAWVWGSITTDRSWGWPEGRATI